MCQNGGVCSLVGNNYKCSCIGEFFGLNCQHKILNSTTFKNSTILTNEQSLDLLKLIGLNKTTVKLLYQSSRDGFDGGVFHSKCDGVSATLTVIKSKNSNIFGGVTSADWSGNGLYKYDSTALLFSLENDFNVPLKMNTTQSNNAIYCAPYRSIGFGAGYDLSCYNDQCESNLGHSYQLPSFLRPYTNEAQSFLGGSYFFQAVEIETYWIDRDLFYF